MKRLLRLLDKYHYVLVFILLEVLSFILLSNNQSYQHSRLVNLNREITGNIYHLVDGSREYLKLKKTNEILVRENTSLRNQIEKLRITKDTLSMHKGPDRNYFYIPARVVHSSVFKQNNYITINKGRKQGVDRDMAVISDQGIVGIILESSANFSTIIPVINRSFRLSAKIKRNNYTGILQWEGLSPEEAVLKEIPYHASVNSGDTIVTSGYSAIFPEGLFIGTVKDYSIQGGNFYNITVTLGTDFYNLFHVNVINNFTQEEQRQIEKSSRQ